jgi:hypothetical protein
MTCSLQEKMGRIASPLFLVPFTNYKLEETQLAFAVADQQVLGLLVVVKHDLVCFTANA